MIVHNIFGLIKFWKVQFTVLPAQEGGQDIVIYFTTAKQTGFRV